MNALFVLVHIWISQVVSLDGSTGGVKFMTNLVVTDSNEPDFLIKYTDVTTIILSDSTLWLLIDHRGMSLVFSRSWSREVLAVRDRWVCARTRD